VDLTPCAIETLGPPLPALRRRGYLEMAANFFMKAVVKIALSSVAPMA
jgi:hypothetical protein